MLPSVRDGTRWTLQFSTHQWLPLVLGRIILPMFSKIKKYILEFEINSGCLFEIDKLSPSKFDALKF